MGFWPNSLEGVLRVVRRSGGEGAFSCFIEFFNTIFQTFSTIIVTKEPK
jgi:hypothetical protein